MQRAKDQLEQNAGQVTHQVEQKAGQLTEQAKQQATSQLESQKQRATGNLSSVAHALHQTGDQLHQQDQGRIGDYAHQAADHVERFSGYLRNRDVNQMIGEAEGLARREPALFLGGAFALGLLAARFLKSSSQPDQQRSSSSPSLGRRTPGQSSTYPRTLEPARPEQVRDYAPGAVVSVERSVVVEKPRYAPGSQTGYTRDREEP